MSKFSQMDDLDQWENDPTVSVIVYAFQRCPKIDQGHRCMGAKDHESDHLFPKDCVFHVTYSKVKESE